MTPAPLQPLVDYRVRRGLTQEALAEELGVSSVTVSRWESGARRIDIERLSRVSEHTNIPMRELRPDLADIMGSAA